MEKNKQPKFRSYLIGFALSIALTFSAYAVVRIHLDSEHSIISHSVLLPLILVLAVIQLIVQLFFFLHLGSERAPRWNLVIFLSTISIIFIIVAGSVWIMNHLNYNMTPQEINQYLINESG